MTDIQANTKAIEQMTNYGNCKIILFEELKSGENANQGEISTQHIKIFDSSKENSEFLDSVLTSWNKNVIEIVKTPEEIEEFIREMI